MASWCSPSSDGPWVSFSPGGTPGGRRGWREGWSALQPLLHPRQSETHTAMSGSASSMPPRGDDGAGLIFALLLPAAAARIRVAYRLKRPGQAPRGRTQTAHPLYGRNSGRQRRGCAHIAAIARPRSEDLLGGGASSAATLARVIGSVDHMGAIASRAEQMAALAGSPIIRASIEQSHAAVAGTVAREPGFRPTRRTGFTAPPSTPCRW